MFAGYHICIIYIFRRHPSWRKVRCQKVYIKFPTLKILSVDKLCFWLKVMWEIIYFCSVSILDHLCWTINYATDELLIFIKINLHVWVLYVHSRVWRQKAFPYFLRHLWIDFHFCSYLTGWLIYCPIFVIFVILSFANLIYCPYRVFCLFYIFTKEGHKLAHEPKVMTI